MACWKTRQEVTENVLGWMVVAVVGRPPCLVCLPIVFQEESGEFPVPCVEALLRGVNVLMRFLF